MTALLMIFDDAVYVINGENVGSFTLEVLFCEQYKYTFFDLV